MPLPIQEIGHFYSKSPIHLAVFDSYKISKLLIHKLLFINMSLCIEEIGFLELIPLIPLIQLAG